MSVVHQVAQSGFGAGTNELYDRARPSYQKVSLDFIRDALPSHGELNVLEIGAGTGIFTRALLADPAWNNSIRELRAVEPSEGMRNAFTSKITDKRVSISDGVFQSTGAQDAWADLIVIAQAFHWCPDYNAASAEFARVLKPQGIMAFIWNLEDREGAEWVGRLRDAYEAHEQGTPQFRLMLWRQAFETPSYKQNFQKPEEHVSSYTLHTTKEHVVDRVFSKSYIAVLPDDQKTEVKNAVQKILDESNKSWIDEAEGIFEYPYRSFTVVARRK
ncbi:S-adenosyl-L-methionine-dependent methyltransferase [Crepidotus variabilis]|uniref:S-adenosyl-L-methionine-dependent methyltransferase n=1 Tax=Crepidotus variabilis TaxID=179855 RepID=A0A9P6EQF7_9AGAR|nr:S-adenosyl-L-methionine-dependent methyltransferase [Crepidotus variabilis]